MVIDMSDQRGKWKSTSEHIELMRKISKEIWSKKTPQEMLDLSNIHKDSWNSFSSSEKKERMSNSFHSAEAHRQSGRTRSENWLLKCEEEIPLRVAYFKERGWDFLILWDYDCYLEDEILAEVSSLVGTYQEVG